VRVAIAIVGYRNVEDVRRCIGAIDASSYRDFEVVVCENGGTEAYQVLVAALPARLTNGQSVRVIDAGANLGYGGGVNLAMAQAPDVDAWWILNPDTEPSPSALGELVARLERGDCDAVGGLLWLSGGTVQSYGGQWQRTLARAVSIGYGADTEAPVDTVAVERRQSFISGACMLISRRFRDIAGPMRDDYFLYGEEVEWCLRARRRGLRLGFSPLAKVMHAAGSTTGSHMAFRQMPKTPVYLNERNRILVTRDTEPSLTPIVALSALGVIAARFGRRGALRQVGYAIQGWWAGLAGRRGPPDWIAPIQGR
jgi:N-acetylglucosaminyl-diphospho-decaprenol L-rhamnosyltransferase